MMIDEIQHIIIQGGPIKTAHFSDTIFLQPLKI